jgi:hypothetical protein
MQYNDAIRLMKDMDALHVKVVDTGGKRVYECLDELSVENTIAKLNAFLPTLKSYGKVNFIAATEGIKKQNFKDAYHWPVTFDGSTDTNVQTSQNNSTQGVKQGYVSAKEAELMASIERLTLMNTYDKKLADLEAKISGKPEDRIEKMISKYLPILGAFVKIDDEKINNMMRIAQIQGMQAPQQNAIAGLNIQQNPKPQIQATAEEQKIVAEIITEMDKLEQKVSVDKILLLLKGLNEKPEFAEQAINFMKMSKQS